MIRIRRWALLSAVAGTSLTLSACNRDGFGESTLPGPNPVPAEKVEIGQALFKKEPAPSLTVDIGVRNPIIVPSAVVKTAEKQLLPAQVDAYIELIALQMPPGSKYDPNDKQIVTHPRDEKEKLRYFRQLRPGMPVKKGEVVAWLDASQIEAQYINSQKMIESTAEGISKSKESIDKIDELLSQMKKLEKDGVSSRSEVLQYMIQKNRFEENWITSKQSQIKALQDFETAASLLRKHQPTAVVSGIVTNVFKRPGEFAKAGEPILEIQSTEEVLIEGELPIQYFGQVKPGTQARIESTRPLAENRELGAIAHRREVTGLAVTSHPGRPLVVSSGMDGVALVWEPFAKKLPHSLPHPVAVRAVAVTGPKATGSYAATGSDDGKIRIWNLSNPDKLPSKDAVVAEEGHASAITAVTFSPDGKIVASAAGREVILWEAATGKKMYTLPSEHKDAVTALRFTPQCTLVTVCRDKAIRVWNVGTLGASLEKTMDHRAGVVDHLAVTADGGRVLFDQDESRIDLVSLADGQSVGTILAAGQARFATLAVFSPDDSLILTAGGTSMPGELQVWETPKSRGRGFERVRLVTPGRTPVTCAAFSGDAEKKFVVVGTATGGIHAWTPPSDKETRLLTGTVESVLNYNDKAAMVRIRVSNPPADLLQDRGTANVIIDPDATAATSRPGLTVPAATAPPAAVTPASASVPMQPTPNISGLGTPLGGGTFKPTIPSVPDKKNP
jgi:WD40 repeat protein